MSTTVVKRIEPQTLRNWRKYFSQYGTIQKAQNSTGIHRTTIARLLKDGSATELVVEKLESYFQTLQQVA